MLDYFNSFKLKAWHILVLLVVLELIFAFFTNSFVLSFDEAIWQCIGRNWFRNGLVPYTGGVDNKSPLIYIIYGVSDYLFGVNYWFPRLLAIAFQTTGIYFVYRIARHVSGQPAAMLAMIIYGFSLLWKSTNGKMVSLTQTYEIGFLIMSIYFLLIAANRRHLLIAGMLAGMALMFRFSAAPVILLMAVSLIFSRSFLNALQFTIGLLIVTGSILSLFLLAGINLHDFVSNSFVENFAAGSVTDHAFAWKAEQFANAFFYSELILFYPFVIGYLFIHRKPDIFLWWLTGAFISIAIIGMYAQAHLKELLPALSIISAVSVVHLVTVYKMPLRALYLVIAISFFPKDLEPLIGIKKFLMNTSHAEGLCSEPFKEDEGWNRKLGEWIDSNTKPGETVFVAGYGAQVQAYSCRLSPTIYFNATQTPAAKQGLFFDLTRHRPAMIVIPLFAKYDLVAKDIRAFISQVLAKDYSFDRCLFSYNIYRRKIARN